MQIGVYGNQTKTSYLYTPDGFLSEVTIDGRSTWKYRYGLNGQLTGVSKNGNFKLLNYDQVERFVSYLIFIFLTCIFVDSLGSMKHNIYMIMMEYCDVLVIKYSNMTHLED